MRRGVAYGVMAGALWGAVFLTPSLLGDFSPVLLAAGRYTMYGLVSLAAVLPSLRSLAARLTRADLTELFKQALFGNFVYYVLLSCAVHLVGIAPTSLIIGILPVTVTLAGAGGHGAVPLRRLAGPLALVIAGIACINLDLFTSSAAHATTLASKLTGLACAAGALACWTWYAVGNARYLKAQQRFNGHEWSALWGIVTGLLGVACWLVILALPAHTVQDALPAARWHAFWLLNLGLAIGASWLGNGLWNAASQRLPLTLSGQLIVFETVFALIYGFIYDGRAPRALELAALVLLLAGVYGSVRRHGAQPPDEERAAAQAQAAAALDGHP